MFTPSRPARLCLCLCLCVSFSSLSRSARQVPSPPPAVARAVLLHGAGRPGAGHTSLLVLPVISKSS